MPTLALKQQSKQQADVDSSGGRLVSVDGHTLPLTGADLRAEAQGGIARATLTQTFRNTHREPLRVSYRMPLPADGAVSGFVFTVAGQRIVGEVDRKQAARERFERALVEGRTAAILDQERSSVFTQEVGNVPAGAEVKVELSIDQKLAWLPDGLWEWRFPTVLAPRYLGATGSVPDGERVMVDVADQPMGIPLSLGVVIRDALTPGGAPESPSHALHRTQVDGAIELGFADERGGLLDRDVVVRWPAAREQVGVAIQRARHAPGSRIADSAFGLLTLTPPMRPSSEDVLPRDLIVLLDTSGSMSGMPLDQARRVVGALIDSLTDQDQLELIEFSSAPRRWKRNPVSATHRNREDARGWLAKLSAGGGTEMRSGILEALDPLRTDVQRQIVLVTDGLIGGEREVLQALYERLPASSRLHVVGVGSGVNRSLTLPASRAGRGVELVIGLGEDPERFAQRLVARTCAPLVTELTVSGSAVQQVAPARAPDVFAGSPSLISVQLAPEGGELIVRGKTAEGVYEQRLQVPPTEPGTGHPGVVALFGREKVEDHELTLAAQASNGADLDAEIERLGIAFQLSTRLTSWVAVSEAVTVDPLAPTRNELVPQNLPYGMSVEGLGLRAPTGMPMPVGGAVPRRSRMYGGIADGKMKKKDMGDKELARNVPTFAEAEEDDAFASLVTAAPAAPMADAPSERAASGSVLKGRSDIAGAPPPRDWMSRTGAPAPQPPAANKPAPGSPVRTWKGRVLLRETWGWVLELIAPEATQWELPTEVTVTLADGTTRTVPVDASRSTRAGNVAAQAAIRLALLASDVSAALVRIAFTNSHGTFVVHL